MNRAKLELKLSEAQRWLDRLIDAIAAGVITTEEAGQRAPTLRAEVESAKAARAAASEPRLHPGVVNQYLCDLDRLDQ
jgi:hypothetical protein